MKLLLTITLLLAVHLSTATIDVESLANTATNKLQTLAQQASSTLQGLAENIDMEKVKQLDFLNIIPRIQDRLNHSGPSHLDKIKFYLGKAKSLSGRDLLVAFDADLPWPVLRRMDKV